MAAKDSTSKKQSDASLEHSTQQPDSLVFFTDVGLGRYDVPNALRAAGLTVEIHGKHFPADCLDQDWLPEVGQRGWIVLSKDKSFSSRQIEVAALMRSGTGTFVLTNSNTTGPENAAAFIKAIPSMLKFIKKFPKPFLARVTPRGTVELFLTHEMMLDLYAKLPR